MNYSILSYTFIVHRSSFEMAVRTRSSYKTSSSSAATTAATKPTPRRAARFTTSSYVDSSIRSYKTYIPKRRHVRVYESEESEPESGSEIEFAEAAEAMVSMGDADSESADSAESYDSAIPTVSFQRGSCLNPMCPVTRYIYKLSVYNMAQTNHDNTTYVMYNCETRKYHVYSIISTMLGGGGGGGEVVVDATGAAMEESLPAPTNTIQTKYTTYMNADKYIMNVVIPSDQSDYCVLADLVGVIGDDNEFKQRAFGVDSCYYDIDELWNSNDSDETLTGHKMFILTPTRVYYWDAGVGVVSAESKYTSQYINIALDIIASVQ